jgi:hypothetical protein
MRRIFARPEALITATFLVLAALVMGACINPLGADTIIDDSYLLGKVLSIETAAGGSGSAVTARTLANGATLPVYAVVRDKDGTFITNISVAWSDPGGKGVFTSATGTSSTYIPNTSGGTTTLRATLSPYTAATTGTLTISYDVLSISGLTFWLRAESLLSSLSNGGSVTSWTDNTSGLGYSVSQGTAANEPTFVTNALNTYPIVRFDGTDDVLAGTTTLDQIVDAGGTKYSAFIVFSATGGGAGESIISDTSGAGNFGLTLPAGPQVQANHNAGTETIATNISLSTSYLFNWVLSTTPDFYSYLNGAGFTNAAPTVATTVTGTLNIGADNTGAAGYFSGDIAEIITFNTELSSTDRQTVNTYLCRKYNINGGSC